MWKEGILLGLNGVLEIVSRLDNFVGTLFYIPFLVGN